MGEALDKNRQTRFPPSGPRDDKSQQKNLAELESAILFLQDQVTTLTNAVKNINATLDVLTSDNG